MKKLTILLIGLFISFSSIAQVPIPDVFDGFYNDNGKIFYLHEGEKFYEEDGCSPLTLANLQGNPKGSDIGLKFDFKDRDLSGKMYFGLIDYTDSKHPSPVWYSRTASIETGKAEIDISSALHGTHDMTGWEKSGKGTLGYRIANSKGELLYQGIIGFKYEKDKGFSIARTITEGPFINLLNPNSVTISFDTNLPILAKVMVNNKAFISAKKGTHHEIKITDLNPSTTYSYIVDYGDGTQEYHFKTAPKSGSRKPFTFAYTSDSRAGQGGGEHNMYGSNFYMMRKITALAASQEVAFMQFTGDMVNGYSQNKDDINLQYANWKRSIEPFAHYFPIVAAPGNHEMVGKAFKNGKSWLATIPGFPFETESPAAVFANNFVNPVSDLISEDGAYYDPDPNKTDFPPYAETVFYYTYDNVAIIVLNSNYLYTPTIKRNPKTGGNLHGYLMDNQIKWLGKTLKKLEKDATIDHIFVTQHTPAFPDGGHVKDDMWYGGDNTPRPTIAGTPVNLGIIERRDEYLQLLINQSTKVVAILTGDEHNYNKVKITPEVNLYPADYPKEKQFARKRTIWQINNGSAGAPYYAQDKNTPWTNAVSGFTTQNALVFFKIDGKKVDVTVKNPDTLELIEAYKLR